MKDFENVIVKTEYPSGIIQLNRPEKMNALSIELMDEVREAVNLLDADNQVRGIIITGNEKAFSTGVDLDQAIKVNDIPTYRDKLSPHWFKMNEAVENATKPVIAAVRGYCLTGGFELALACDIRIAGYSARFGITSSKIGTVAGAGGTQRLPRLVGPSIAKELLMTARFVDPEEAFQLRIVNKVVDDELVIQTAKEMVDVFAQRAPLSLWWAKHVVNKGMNMDLDSALAFESALTTQAFMTEDKKEGIQAFLEKRAPNFKGR